MKIIKCYNDITIKGNGKFLRELDKNLRADYTDFDVIMLPSNEIKNFLEDEFLGDLYDSSIVIEDAENARSLVFMKVIRKGYSFNNILPIQMEDYPNSKKWRIENWGASNDLDSTTLQVLFNGDSELHYKFLTDYTPALGISTEIASLLPYCEIIHEYHNDSVEDEHFEGIARYTNGYLV